LFRLAEANANSNAREKYIQAIATLLNVSMALVEEIEQHKQDKRTCKTCVYFNEECHWCKVIERIPESACILWEVKE
jgi:recombinational DNA repair protein RecR